MYEYVDYFLMVGHFMFLANEIWLAAGGYFLKVSDSIHPQKTMHNKF